jgi:hypothetical protein
VSIYTTLAIAGFSCCLKTDVEVCAASASWSNTALSCQVLTLAFRQTGTADIPEADEFAGTVPVGSCGEGEVDIWNIQIFTTDLTATFANPLDYLPLFSEHIDKGRA